MKYVLLAVLAVVALFAYWGARFFYMVSISKQLVQHTTPFQNLSSDTSESILVLGDSTAVGVGATNPTDSVAGRTASYLHATYVENHAVSGAVVSDLPQQISEAKLPSYNLILIQIGANDIVRYHNASSTADMLGGIVSTLPKTGQVLVISAGDVGSSPLIPPPFRPFYSKLNRSYHDLFAKVLAAHGATYINLTTSPGNDLFSKDPQKYFAADKFHPSSDGYGIWFEAIKPHLALF